MEKTEELVSLFEYLGYAAGGQLGKEVAAAAIKCKETIAKRAISTRTYTGDVLLYRREFLNEFFNNRKNLGGIDPSEVRISVSDIQDYKL